MSKYIAHSVKPPAPPKYTLVTQYSEPVRAYAIVTNGSFFIVTKTYKTGTGKKARVVTEEVFSDPSILECHGYIARIAEYKYEHYAHKYTNMGASARTVKPIKSGYGTDKGRPTRSQNRKAAQKGQRLKELNEAIGKLSVLKKYGYITPKSPDLPTESDPNKYDAACTEWAVNKRDEIERRTILRKYGYVV